MSEEQTFRSADNGALPLRKRQLSVWWGNYVKHMEAASQGSKKTLKLHTPVSSPLQICPSLIFQLRNPGSCHLRFASTRTSEDGLTICHQFVRKLVTVVGAARKVSL